MPGKLNPEDYIGKVYNYWELLEYVRKIPGHHIYMGKCLKCGKIKEVRLSDVKGGRSRMCRECCEREKSKNQLSEVKIGEVYGCRRVIADEGMAYMKGSKSHMVATECIYCGKVCHGVNLSDLKMYKIRSCECFTDSFAVKQIKKILTENDIKFSTEKTFTDLYNKKAKYKNRYRFDFCIYTDDGFYLLEYDGEQHTISSSWDKYDSLEHRQKRDKIKNEYCFSNNIPIIRIPFDVKEDIKLEDLIPETSKFLVTPQ